MQPIIEQIKNRQSEIHDWLNSQEFEKELPLYFSVDIRDAGFKRAVVDTNLFPAGFNNLCEHGLSDSVALMRDAILRRVPHCKNVLIIAEEHTRNTWYLENIRILQEVIKNAGFDAVIATFLYVQPTFCENTKTNHVEFATATGKIVEIFCLNNLLEQIKSGMRSFDLIILNNDLTDGMPEILKDNRVPIYPAIQAGWHSRLKSHHFKYTNNLMSEFSDVTGLDPWLFSCLYKFLDNVDINNDSDRKKMADAASDLCKRIESKYKEHSIKEKPYVVIKSDSGTYGMGVLPIEDPKEIIDLNRKDKNKLHKGKGSRVISRYLLQEGVPTIYNIDQQVSEVVIYQIANKLVGGFYRSHSGKTNRENLNARGMEFKKMCPHSPQYGDCGIHHDVSIFDVYRILARIAGIAARREMIDLEAISA